MQPVNISGFLGANTSLDPKLLPDGVGVVSTNQRPGKGDLRPWKVPLQVATVPTATQRKTIWRMGQDTANDAQYWLSWTTIVHAIRGFDPSDPTERTYFTGSGTPKWTDNVIGLAGTPYPVATRELAVPAPTTALTATQNTAGTGTDETWYYVHTFVNDKGWESAPSPSSAALTAKPGAIIDLTSLEAAPAGAYGITLRRIYKTKTSASGATEFYFLREIASGLTSTQDDARALGADVLPTGGQGTGSSWVPPPADAHSLTAMWNGMAAVLSGKSVRPCEPYALYAYPLRYEIALQHTGVALAVWGQRLLALTTGDPVLITGSDPMALDDEPTKIMQPCMSAAAVQSFPNGVAWASPNGAWWLGDDGSYNLLENVIDADTWSAMNPSTMIFGRHKELPLLFIFYNDGSKKGLVVDLRNRGSVYPLASGYDAVFRDPISGAMYVLDGGNVQRWDGGSTFMTATHRTKAMRQRAALSFGAVQVVASSYPVTLKVWGGGVLKADRSVPSDKPVRLKDGRAEEWQVEASSTGAVQAIRLANSLTDFKR
jgi:hypothetical protein